MTCVVNASNSHFKVELSKGFKADFKPKHFADKKFNYLKINGMMTNMTVSNIQYIV